jgi:hypothetical protein
MIYIPGEDNTVADTLSHIPPNSFPDEQKGADILISANTVFSITSNVATCQINSAYG